MAGISSNSAPRLRRTKSILVAQYPSKPIDVNHLVHVGPGVYHKKVPTVALDNGKMSATEWDAFEKLNDFAEYMSHKLNEVPNPFSDHAHSE